MPDLALLQSIQSRLTGATPAPIAPRARELPAVLPGGEQLPALPEPARLAAVAETTAANSQYTERDLQRRDQRREWVWEVWQLTQERRCSEGDAASLASRGAVTRYPALAAKSGRHPLSTAQKALRMYRHWKGKLGTRANGEPVWANADELIDGYQRGLVRPPGSATWRELFMRYHLSENQPALAVSYRWACRTYRQRHPMHSSDDIPSESAVRRWYDRHIPDNVKALYRKGQDYFEAHFADYISCDWSRYRVREIWVWDSRVFDSLFRRWDEAAGKWVATRAWLVGAVDVRSGWFVGLDILPGAATAWDIEMTWRRAIHNNDNRPPRYIIRDHGSDYEGAGMFRPVTMPNGYQTSQAMMLSVQDAPAEVRNAQRKIIERLFRDVAGEYDKGQPSYLGAKTSDRPSTAEWYFKHPEELPTLQEFTEAFKGFLWDWYQRAKEGETTVDMHPLDAWRTAPHIRPRLSDEQLAEYLLRPLKEPRIVARGGRLRIDKEDYQSNRLVPFVGQQLMVKVDMVNGGVYAYNLEGQPVAAGLPITKVDGLEAGDDELSRQIAHCREARADAYAIGLDLRGGDELQIHAACELWGLPAPDRAGIEAREQRQKRLEAAKAKPLPRAVGDDQVQPPHQGAGDLLAQLQSHEVDVDTEARGPVRQSGSALQDLFKVIETDGNS